MNTTKLQEALSELQWERTVIDSAISKLQEVIASVGNSSVMAGRFTLRGVQGEIPKKRTYIDDAVDILAQAGEPLHVEEIVKRIAAQRGGEVTRGSVESSIIRHGHALGGKARIVRTGRGTFGLPAMKHNGLGSNRPAALVAQ